MTGESLLHALPMGVLVWDDECRLLLLNPAARDLLGWEPAEAIGRECSTLAAVAEQAGLVRAALAGDAVQPGSAVLQGRDGAALPVELSVMPARDDAGRTLAVMAVRDLRPELTAGAPGPWVRVLGAAAHELRQPLAGAMLILQAMMRHPDRSADNLPRLEAELNQVEAAIQRLLTLARMGG